MIYTSLREIQSFRPCPRGWYNILCGQNKTYADDVLFPLTEAVESNSISDVCWLLGKRKTEIQVCVKFAHMCADSVAHLKNSAANYAAYVAANYAANAAEFANYAAGEFASAKSACAASAYRQQKERNKQFLLQCITEFQPE